MQHPCNQCGSSVENDSPFCANCGAPQVRFAEPITERPILTIREAESAYASAETPPSAAVSPVTAAAHSRAILRSAIYGGAVGAFLSAVPYAFVVALPLAGYLAVLFYARRMNGARVTRRLGLRLGALTGVFSYTIFILLAGFETMSPQNGGQLRQEMLNRLQHAMAANPDPQTSQLLAYFQTPQGLAILMACGMAFMLLIFCFLAGISGAISAEMLSRKPPRVG